ncbi:Xaa-Pro peptidase family protein [Nocardioides sp. LHD-245]|uniref:M24 family metallopeptidase n=1 Tax=Nocardioides sp. LHD-245 TaxID=3051387 RepID=UPI0027E0BF95|nr:Xaa-Pro peptidase family protein [Nocardioides sp. LHD-245]
MTAAHEVPQGEVERRVGALRERLAAAGLERALLTSEPNVHYLSGIRTPSFHSNSRPLALVVPVDGPTVLVCSRSQAPNAEATAWVGDIAPFEGFEAEAVTVLTDLLQGAGVGPVAAELGDDTRPGVSGSSLMTLQRDVGPLADVAPCLWELRTVKSDWEIAALREAGRINGAAFDAARAAYRPGMTERDVYAVWGSAVMASGADSPGYLAMHSGPGNYRRVSGLAGDRVLTEGDLLWLDGGPRWRGYWSDVTRTFAVGEPQAGHQDLYAASRAATYAVMAASGPGLSTTDLFDVVARAFRDAGLEIGSATRIGHGLGLQLTEPPSLLPSVPVRLAPGMVLAVEPGIARPDGYFNVEENFLVTADGAELVSAPSAPTILTLGA